MDSQLAILEKDKERLIEELRSADREVQEADLLLRLPELSRFIFQMMNGLSRRALMSACGDFCFIIWKMKRESSGKRRSTLCAKETTTEGRWTNCRDS
jgi:hypothetical protein